MHGAVLRKYAVANCEASSITQLPFNCARNSALSVPPANNLIVGRALLSHMSWIRVRSVCLTVLRCTVFFLHNNEEVIIQTIAYTILLKYD